VSVAYDKPIASRIANLTWSAPPLVICPLFPYIVSLLPKALEVHDYEKEKLVQSIPVQEKTPFTVAAASADGHRCALACTGTGIHGNAPACVFELRMQSVDKQIQELLLVHKFEDALKLFEKMNRDKRGTPEYTQQLSNIHKEAAKILMRGLKFSEAFDHFGLAGVDPREPLVWFPGLDPRGTPAPSDPAFKPVETLIFEMFKKSQSGEKYVKEAKQCLLDYLRSNQRTLVHKNNIFGLPDQTMLSDVNSAIVKLLCEICPDDVEEFVRKNSANLNATDVESFLRDKRKWQSLAVFFESQGRTKDALDVWRKLGTGELRDPPHNGVKQTVDALSRPTTDFETVWEYADWLVRKHASEALKVFCSKEHEWNIDEVSHYLEVRDPLTACKYLEMKVSNNETTDSKHFTRLATMYITDLVKTIQLWEEAEKKKQGTPGAAAARPRRHSVQDIMAMEKGAEFLRTHNRLIALMQNDGPVTEGAEAVLNIIAQNKLGDRDLFDEQIAAYSRLGRHHEVFLLMIDKLKDDARAEAYCFHNRTPRETGDLLAILFNIYLMLDGPLKTQDDPNAARELTPRGANLLNKYGRSIDPVKVLSSIPGDIGLGTLYPFLKKALQSVMDNRRDSQMVRALLRVQNLQARCELGELQSPGFFVDEHSLCAECHKELTGNIFVKKPYPSMEIICYLCYAKRYGKKIDPDSSHSSDSLFGSS